MRRYAAEERMMSLGGSHSFLCWQRIDAPNGIRFVWITVRCEPFHATVQTDAPDHCTAGIWLQLILVLNSPVTWVSMDTPSIEVGKFSIRTLLSFRNSTI